jgi:Zn-dependent peptidase ImmA (M78 family)
MNYQGLAAQALKMALQTRIQAGTDLIGPVCSYDICTALEISVKFVDINMEGVYVREPKPRIIISALRPLARRNFTCGHELGHHVFGHGSNLDLLAQERNRATYIAPEEFLVDSFASFLLMPAIGIRKAFASRGWNATTATPLQIFTIACNFGVGYTTLVNYLLYSLRCINGARAGNLLKSTPQAIKEQFLDCVLPGPLVIVDEKWLAKTVDTEVGTYLALPPSVLPSNEMLLPVEESAFPSLFVAAYPGIVRISNTDNSWAIFVRVMPYQFQGLAKYRHLERGEDD